MIIVSRSCLDIVYHNTINCDIKYPLLAFNMIFFLDLDSKGLSKQKVTVRDHNVMCDQKFVENMLKLTIMFA